MSLLLFFFAGLATDFSLHYGVSYRACSLEKNLDRATVALKQMGGPTLMAAITSGAAGALMLPSQVLAYIQIGLFLILVMGVSWIYATFFLCPILAIVGPSPTFAQFQYLRYDIFIHIDLIIYLYTRCFTLVFTSIPAKLFIYHFVNGV